MASLDLSDKLFNLFVLFRVLSMAGANLTDNAMLPMSKIKLT